MKKVLLLSALLLVGFAFKGSDAKVFVCDSSTSVAYHSSKNCRGLQKCTHEIINVPKNDAINVYGKRACKICY